MSETYVTPGHPVMAGAGYDCQCGQCLAERDRQAGYTKLGSPGTHGWPTLYRCHRCDCVVFEQDNHDAWHGLVEEQNPPPEQPRQCGCGAYHNEHTDHADPLATFLEAMNSVAEMVYTDSGDAREEADILWLAVASAKEVMTRAGIIPEE